MELPITILFFTSMTMITIKFIALGELHMENYCAFSKNHKCMKWTDYELTRHELEEADALCQRQMACKF